MMPLQFLDLPPEIREKIYLGVCVDPENYILLSGSQSSHPYFPLSLLLTCQQLYDEVRPLYFTMNKFAINLERHNEPLSYFLLPSFSDNLRSINTIRLTIIRWGARDYFLTTLAPILSDLILKGGLRHLEVRAKKSDLLAYDAARDISRLNTSSAVIAELVRICEDSYLETVNLQTYVPTSKQAGSSQAGQPGEFIEVTHLLNRKPSIR